MLADPTISTILVEHRDRLARFGAEAVEAALDARGAASWWSIHRKRLMILCVT